MKVIMMFNSKQELELCEWNYHAHFLEGMDS